jgi:phage replication initiation protein
MSNRQFCSSSNAGSKQRASSLEPGAVSVSSASRSIQSQSNDIQSQVSASPPYSNTGGKSLDEAKLAFIDWLAFTINPPSTVEPLAWINAQLQEVFNLPGTWIETGKGWNGYRHRINLQDFGLLAYGGKSQLDSYHVEINGHGCALVADWEKVRQWGESHGARITRSDFAHDDHEGKTVSIQQAIDWYEEGGFVTSGRPPKRQLIDDFDSGDGKTLYIGARENGKLCRVYEKGRQLGDKLSAWVRVELELRNKSRVIPWDVVINPGHYLAGAYPCLQFLSVIQQRIRTIQKAVNMSYAKMVAWAKKAAGKVISTMLEVNQGDAGAVLSQLVRPGRPRRLQHFEDFDIHVLILGAT